MNKEAMKLALEALEFDGFTPEDATHRSYHAKAIISLKQALEQPEPEPVAEVRCDDGGNLTAKFHVRDLPLFAPLYTSPPKREWQKLTDEEIDEGQRHSWVEKQAFESAVWWAEAKLKEKNA